MLRTFVLLLFALAVAPAASGQCPPVTLTLADGAGNETTDRFESAVPDGQGGFFVTWKDDLALRCFIQRVDGAGNPLWTPGGVAFTPSGEQVDPEVIAVDDGQGGTMAIVRWTHGTFPDPATVRLQKFDAAGVPQWSPGGVLAGASRAEDAPRVRTIAPDGAGGVIVAWEDRGVLWQIRAQRIDAAGVPQWGSGGVLVCAIDQAGRDPSVVTDGAGGAYVVWQDTRVVPGPSLHYGQRLDANGVPQWAADGIPLTPATETIPSWPNIREDGTGGLLLAWVGGTDVRLRAQRVDPLGTLLWDPSGLLLSNVTMLGTPVGGVRIVPDGSGGALAAWSDGRQGLFQWDVYAQKVSAAGALQWPASGAPILAGPDSPFLYGADSDGAGGLHLTCAILGNDLDIWYQRVDANGDPVLPGAGLLLADGPHHERPAGLVALDSGDVAIPYADEMGVNTDFKALVLAPPAVVTTTADSGPGSLRAALLAGGTCSAISFDVPGAGPHTIALQSPLPVPAAPVVIDARTQPGYAGTPRVEVDGTALGGAAPGLDLTAAGGEVYGLALFGFPGDAVVLGGAAGRVEACHLGVDAASTAIGNGGAGVAVVSGAGHVIRANAMAGNGGLGIDIAPLGAVNANDAGDSDGGVNSSQNFPTVELAFGAAPVIQGTLDSTPNTGFDIDVYVSPVCDALYGHGEGLVHLGVATVVTDGTGFATYSLGVAPTGLSGYLTATATGPDGTSEFSTCGATLETVAGEGVVVAPRDAVTGDQPATLEFEVVDTAGTTTLTSSPSGPYLPGYFAGESPVFYDISTTAVFGGGIDIAMGIDPTPFLGREDEVRLLHFENGEWRDVTVRVDVSAGLVYGRVTSLSPFVLAIADEVAPVGDVPGFGAALPLVAAPNPFNPRTNLSFALAAPGTVTLRIHDARGRVVRTLVSGALAAGPHRRTWDSTSDTGRRLASGVYFARLQADGAHALRKLTLVK